MSGQAGGGPAAVPDKGRARLKEAVADLRRAQRLLLSVSDPRAAVAYLEAMRSCITGSAEIAGSAAGSIAHPCADAGDVQAVCGRAPAAVDQILAGIAGASRFSQRHAGWDREASAASRATVRQLLTDRLAVDTSSHELLFAAAGYPSQAHAAPGKEAPPVMTGTSADSAERTGPWTLRCCVTAACTGCGAVPLDEDSGWSPHFASTGQAREELPRDWDWQLTTPTDFADDDELLYPKCAAAGDPGNSQPPAPVAGGQEPGTAPWWQGHTTPGRGLPPNAAIFPAVGPAPDGG